MNVIEIAPLLFLPVVLAIATVNDIRFHKIPNWLTFPAVVLGIAYHTYTKGTQGLFFSLEGLFLGLAVFIPFYLTAGMGAGDVKLMAAVGGLLGPKGVFMAFIGTALIGGIYSIVLLAIHGHFMNTVKRYGSIAKTFIFTGRIIYFPPENKEKMPVLPYGVAITIGTLLSVVKGVI